jgi:DNA-binding transcriptional LysR family regulator
MHLRNFKAITEQNNLTRAAELLHISQPALSASLSKLENELGVRLFDRVGRNLQLNQYGNIYINYVNQALLSLDNAEIEIDNCMHLNKQKLTISTVSLQLIQGLIRILRTTTRRSPSGHMKSCLRTLKASLITVTAILWS